MISIGAQRQSQCHTRRAETCCDPSSTNTAVSEQPSARLRRTLCMHAEVKRARWPHLGFFRSPQRFGHSPKLPARPLHGPRLGIRPQCSLVPGDAMVCRDVARKNSMSLSSAIPDRGPVGSKGHVQTKFTEGSGDFGSWRGKNMPKRGRNASLKRFGDRLGRLNAAVPSWCTLRGP